MLRIPYVTKPWGLAVRHFILRQLLALVLVSGLMAACTASGESDVDAQDKVLQRYLTAMQQGDRDELARLAGPRVDATSEIDGKVRAIGAKSWQSIRITWKRGEFPALAEAEISAVDAAGKEVKDNVQIAELDGAWYVGLGAATDARTPSDTRSP